MTTKVGVTGASGQVGSTLVHRLHHEGVNVVAAVRNTLGAALIDASTPGCDIRVGSLTREPGRVHLLDDCDVIINCALASSDGNPRAAYTNNRMLVDGLLEATSLRWLIHFSTVAVYGELIREHRDDSDAFRHPNPDSEYGRSKLYVERYAAQRARARGLKCSVLRLGHVYGARIVRSREIIELARNPLFRLPYGGRFPSDAIHVDRVASAVLALVNSDESREVCSLAEALSTWRDVFDWHTRCLGLPPVAALSDAASDEGRDAYARRSILRDASGWVRGLPIRQLVRTPAMLDLALRILARTPTAVMRHIAGVNRRFAVRNEVAGALGLKSELLPPIYYSAGMPGPFLRVPDDPATGLGSDAARSQDLYEWYQRWSTPKIHARTPAENESRDWPPASFARGRREGERS
jgi:nucleoside-diphosphate-sugar epimerase